MALNMYDQLVDACRGAETWPLNQLRKQQLNRVLYNYQQRLHADQERLLDTKRSSVEFWEVPFGAESKIPGSSRFADKALLKFRTEFQGKFVKSLEELIQHFHEHIYHRVKDPRSRHV